MDEPMNGKKAGYDRRRVIQLTEQKRKVIRRFYFIFARLLKKELFKGRRNCQGRMKGLLKSPVESSSKPCPT